ncbi:GTA-gp10 family protein [Caulobacter hibisci]|uniref:Gene transfer agent family protein n=1 Tax=Caulobacter hibisci TaxID=2035993 RepID=A0ABS0SSA4_9CAUL|nr:GTA-gp10 family protein [Caulobacter hibisci]MBI1682389.1 gene transfer agent family protein [Caulobacter hibisci]
MERAVVPPCEIELEFADGAYLFKLNGPQRAELQRLCGVKANHPQYGPIDVPTGLGAIVSRVLKGRYQKPDGNGTWGHIEDGAWHDADLDETIRLGLIGGGRGLVNGQEVKVDALRARQLIDTYVKTAPRSQAWNLAAAILWTCCQGFVPPKEGDPAPKKETPGETTASSTTPAT